MTKSSKSLNKDALDDSSSSSAVDRFVIRLPRELYQQIKILSDQNHRSINSEIVSVLERYAHNNKTSVNEESENSAEQEVNDRLQDLKDALSQLMS